MHRRIKRVLFLVGCILLGAVVFYGGRISLKSAPLQSRRVELSPISVHDHEGHLLKISIEDIGKYHSHVCSCVVIGFKATQAAISRLWDGELPLREDFRIISKCPTQGTKDVFEYISRARTKAKRKDDFRIELPEGTDIKNVRADNFAFTFIRKSTQEALSISVKESVFPEGFFKMRTKVKNGDATAEEKVAFHQAKQEFKRKLIGLTQDELFIFRQGE